MDQISVYEDIARRTGGNIYIGVVGPVRTGKSTFIKRFMESMVLPRVEDPNSRARARDELPQSGSGRTIMTAEPKFVPEQAVSVQLSPELSASVRLIDSVGYMIPGASGQYDESGERMVTTPWFDHEVPMSLAAEAGTRKVITEHSTIGIVVTTDGSVTDIPREDYIDAERRVVQELKEIGKPFLILLNCVNPASDSAQALAEQLRQESSAVVLPVNCKALTEQDITAILHQILMEFEIDQIAFHFPAWLDALPPENDTRRVLYAFLLQQAESMVHLRDAEALPERLLLSELIVSAVPSAADIAAGTMSYQIDCPRSLYYE